MFLNIFFFLKKMQNASRILIRQVQFGCHCCSMNFWKKSDAGTDGLIVLLQSDLPLLLNDAADTWLEFSPVLISRNYQPPLKGMPRRSFTIPSQEDNCTKHRE